MRRADINPYQSSTSPGGTADARQCHTSTQRSRIATSALIVAITCVIAFYAIGIAQLPARIWDRLPDEVYHAVSIMNVGVFVLGLLACCVAAIFGTWLHRWAVMLWVIPYAPMIPSLFQWIVRQIVGS